MSNQTEQTPAPIDTATARTYTTVSHVTFIDLPDGTIAKLSTMTPDDRADVSICPTMDANGVAGWRIVWREYDEYSGDFDPIEDFEQGDRIDVGRRWQYGIADMDDARDALSNVELGQGRRVFLVDDDGHPRRDWSNMRTWRWVYVAPEDVTDPKEYTEAVWQEWRSWAEGDVHSIHSVEVDKDGNELPDTVQGVHGIIGWEYAAEMVKLAARYGAEGI